MRKLLLNKVFGLVTIVISGVLAIIASSPMRPNVEIVEFKAEPQNLCRGSGTTLYWEVVGADGLSISPSPGDIVPPTSMGNVDVPVEEDTEFTLTARSGSTNEEETTIVEIVPPDGRDFRLATFGECVAGSPSWRFAEAPAKWDAGMTVSLVTSRSSDPLRIQHGSISGWAAPFGEITPLPGERVSGDWTLTPEPIPGQAIEYCQCLLGRDTGGTVVGVPPRDCGASPLGTLVIDVNVRC